LSYGRVVELVNACVSLRKCTITTNVDDQLVLLHLHHLRDLTIHHAYTLRHTTSHIFTPPDLDTLTVKSENSDFVIDKLESVTTLDILTRTVVTIPQDLRITHLQGNGAVDLRRVDASALKTLNLDDFPMYRHFLQGTESSANLVPFPHLDVFTVRSVMKVKNEQVIVPGRTCIITTCQFVGTNADLLFTSATVIAIGLDPDEPTIPIRISAPFATTIKFIPIFNYSSYRKSRVVIVAPRLQHLDFTDVYNAVIIDNAASLPILQSVKGSNGLLANKDLRVETLDMDNNKSVVRYMSHHPGDVDWVKHVVLAQCGAEATPFESWTRLTALQTVDLGHLFLSRSSFLNGPVLSTVTKLRFSMIGHINLGIVSIPSIFPRVTDLTVNDVDNWDSLIEMVWRYTSVDATVSQLTKLTITGSVIFYNVPFTQLYQRDWILQHIHTDIRLT
jgi:hypothetical protein